MKKSKLKVFMTMLTAVVAIGGVISGIVLIPTLGADSTVGASSTDDPLVSLSYINEVVAPQIKADVIASLSDSTSDASGSYYSVICLKYGQKLIAKGSVELILRSGSCTAICPGVNGIGDLTASNELMNSAKLTINNLCMIPGADGRGVICQTGESYLMVRGKYTIE